MRALSSLGFSLSVSGIGALLGSCASTKATASAPPLLVGQRAMPAPDVAFRVESAVPQAPLRNAIDLHLSPGDAVVTVTPGVSVDVDDLTPGTYVATVLSEDAFAEPSYFEVTGQAPIEVTILAVPLSPPCWNASSEACFVVDVSRAEQLYTKFEWSEDFVPDAYIPPHSDDVLEKLRQSSKREIAYVPQVGPIPTIIFGPGVSLRRVQYAAALLTKVGFERVWFHARGFPIPPDRRSLNRLSSVEAKTSTDGQISVAEAKRAFELEEIWFRKCFADLEEQSDWVLLSLTVDVDGLVTKIGVRPGPSRPPSPPPPIDPCSEYDEYMGECRRSRPEAFAPPLIDRISGCLSDAARRLRFPVDEQAPSSRHVELEVKGDVLRAEPRPELPRDELGK